jgi:hypothetical protein
MAIHPGLLLFPGSVPGKARKSPLSTVFEGHRRRGKLLMAVYLA